MTTSVPTTLIGEPRGADDVLAPLANDAMRARHRPGVVLAVWIWETLLALLISFPASAIVRSTYGGHPLQDAPLWTPGSERLIQLFFRAWQARAALTASTALALVLALVVGVVPLGAMLVSIAFATRDRRAPPWSHVGAKTAGVVVPLTAVGALVLLGQGVILGVGLLLGGAASMLASGAGEARADQLMALIFAAFLGLASSLGVAGDLARAGLVRFRVPVGRALRLAWNVARAAPFATFRSWAWRALAGLLLLGVGSVAADRLGGRGGGALLFLAVCHQGVVLARVALRASWLAKALRVVDRTHRVLRPG